TLLIQGRNLFGNQRLFKNTHYALFNKVSTLLTALSTKMTLSACIRSYVLIWSTVITFAFCRFLPESTTFLFTSGSISRVFLSPRESAFSIFTYCFVLALSNEKSSSTAIELSFAL